MSDSQSSAHKPGLSRVLGLWSLIVYGIVLIQPTAPMSPFGVVSVKAEGHVVTTILIGMVAMLFTAISYGRMAAVYPSAGSAYAYVGHTIHPALGYVTGWSMLFDYVMNPIICVIWCSKAAANFGQQLRDLVLQTCADSRRASDSCQFVSKRIGPHRANLREQRII